MWAWAPARQTARTHGSVACDWRSCKMGPIHICGLVMLFEQRFCVTTYDAYRGENKSPATVKNGTRGYWR